MKKLGESPKSQVEGIAPFDPIEVIKEIPSEEVVAYAEIPSEVEPRPYQEYMMDDPGYIGYPTLEMQEEVYRSVAFNILHGEPKVTVLDVGCGRGDFGSYLKKVIEPQYNVSINYQGLDLNRLIVEIGKEKYKDISDLNLLHLQFPFESIEHLDRKFDWVIHCLDLTLPYTTEQDQYEAFENALNGSLQLCNQGVIFMVLNEYTTDSTDNYWKYNIGRLHALLQSKRIKFAIDQSDFQELTKIVVLNQINN